MARSAAPVPSQCYGGTLIDKAACWGGTSCWHDLRRLFKEELVWSKALLTLLYGKHLAFDVSLPFSLYKFLFSLSFLAPKLMHVLFLFFFKHAQTCSITTSREERVVVCVTFNFMWLFLAGWPQRWAAPLGGTGNELLAAMHACKMCVKASMWDTLVWQTSSVSLRASFILTRTSLSLHSMLRFIYCWYWSCFFLISELEVTQALMILLWI